MAEEVDFFNVPQGEAKADSKPIEKEEIYDNTQVPVSNKVIMRVLHTRTEIKIYPNGNTFQTSRTWFEDKHYEVKPKTNKKLVKANQVILQPKEDW